MSRRAGKHFGERIVHLSGRASAGCILLQAKLRRLSPDPFNSGNRSVTTLVAASQHLVGLVGHEPAQTGHAVQRLAKVHRDIIQRALDGRCHGICSTRHGCCMHRVGGAGPRHKRVEIGELRVEVRELVVDNVDGCGVYGFGGLLDCGAQRFGRLQGESGCCVSESKIQTSKQQKKKNHTPQHQYLQPSRLAPSLAVDPFDA